MKYVSLGKRGPKVSAVGIGFWEVGSRSWGGSPEAAKSIVNKALELGINFFDTAEVYGYGKSERALGEAISYAGAKNAVVIATKVAGFRPFAYFILKAAEVSKRRLGVTPALLQLHWPPPAWIPLCTAVRGLELAAEKGLAENIGVSNFPGGLLEKAMYCTKRLEIVSDQVEYSLAYRLPEVDVFPVANKLGVSVIAYSPLAKGGLAGAKPSKPIQRLDPRFSASLNDKNLQEAIRLVSSRRGVPSSVVSLAWIVNKGAIPIPGTTKPERVHDFAAAASLNLTDEEVLLLDRASAVYVTRWGRRYSNLRWARFVPCALQYLGIRAIGGA